MSRLEKLIGSKIYYIESNKLFNHLMEYIWQSEDLPRFVLNKQEIVPLIQQLHLKLLLGRRYLEFPSELCEN